jgi:hypothetical protein
MLDFELTLYQELLRAETVQARKALEWVYRAPSAIEAMGRVHAINERAWDAFMRSPKSLPGIDEIIDVCSVLMSF